MKKSLVFALSVLMSVLANAGGVIGGGVLDYNPILKCNAEGIDPTYPGSSYVWLAQEVDHEGVIEGSTLRVITLDDNLEPAAFYVTEVFMNSADPKSKINIDLWGYDITDSYQKIGVFEWDGTSNSGALRSSPGNDVEELVIRDCTP